MSSGLVGSILTTGVVSSVLTSTGEEMVRGVGMLSEADRTSDGDATIESFVGGASMPLLSASSSAARV